MRRRGWEGWVLKADSVEDLAAQMELDPAVLAETVERYNAFAAAGNRWGFQSRCRKDARARSHRSTRFQLILRSQHRRRAAPRCRRPSFMCRRADCESVLGGSSAPFGRICSPGAATSRMPRPDESWDAISLPRSRPIRPRLKRGGRPKKGGFFEKSIPAIGASPLPNDNKPPSAWRKPRRRRARRKSI